MRLRIHLHRKSGEDVVRLSSWENARIEYCLCGAERRAGSLRWVARHGITSRAA